MKGFITQIGHSASRAFPLPSLGAHTVRLLFIRNPLLDMADHISPSFPPFYERIKQGELLSYIFPKNLQEFNDHGLSSDSAARRWS